MHLFQFAFYTAGVLYALFVEQILLLYFSLVIVLYFLISALYPGAKSLSTRRKIMVASWTPPSQGVIQYKNEIRVDKILKLIKDCQNQNKPTLTHFIIKACGQVLKQSDDLNGKMVFGKFVPYKNCNVSCLVDIDGGKDLAMIRIDDVDKKNVLEISQYIREKSQRIKNKGGDDEHKKRTGIAKIIPTFLVSILIKISSFIFHNLGISIPSLAMKKDQFGAACVTAIGALGFKDAVAPFTPWTGCSFVVTGNAVREAPIIENGEIIIGKVMNINVVSDHRYIDGAKCKKILIILQNVFNQPELYLAESFSKKQQ